MSILEIEKQKNLLIEKLTSCNSVKQKVLLISLFFDELLEIGDNKTREAYLAEFVNDYLNYLSQYDPFCIHPEYSNKILEQLKILRETESIEKFRDKVLQIEIKIQSGIKKLENILEGKSIETESSAKSLFPVLESKNFIAGLTIGNLESLTIKIEKAKNENTFIIIPRERELEERIEKQVHNSWKAALNFCKKYIRKIQLYHKVFIHFDKMQGVYIGNSLGIALTLCFIEELLKFYNAPTVVKIKDRIAFTGGIDEAGNIVEVSKEIIEYKTKCLFFSPVETFVMHRNDEAYALSKFEELKKEFPERKLEIVGVTTLDDLLNRRNLVDIRKQNPVIRGGRFIKKNAVAFTIIAILLSIISSFFIKDIDNNPAVVTTDGTSVFIKNKSGKVLLMKKFLMINEFYSEPRFLKSLFLLIDINNDSQNEIITVSAGNEKKPEKYNDNSLICFNIKGDTLWRYSFNDTVYSNREGYMKSFYGLKIIDTLTEGNHKCLYLFSGNVPSYSSAIFKIDLKTGKKLPGTLWCSGHIVDGLIEDINNDGVKDIVCIGHDNGYEDAVAFAISSNSLNGMFPSTEMYSYPGKKIAELIFCIRIPKNDYQVYWGMRTPGLEEGSLRNDLMEREYQFNIKNEAGKLTNGLSYGLSYNLKDIDIIIENEFRVARDSLVAHGKLNPPYTDSEEYKEILKSKILYWKNGKWVEREGLN